MLTKLKELWEETVSFRFRISFIFILVRILTIPLVLGMYYTLIYFDSIPEFFMGIVSLICIVAYVLFIIPLQESLEVYLRKKLLSEYLYGDTLSLKYAYRNFELKTLISNVFPDMIKVSNSKEGRMIIQKKQNAYDAYSYIAGKAKKIRTQTFNLNREFLEYIESTGDILNEDEKTDPKIRKSFQDLKASTIIPFLYRRKALGFLSLNKKPEESSIQDLKVLASKAAIAVYNHNLADQVARLDIYKKEVETAQKIQGQVFFTKIPKFKSLAVEILHRDPNIILEFFRNKDGGIVLLLLTLNEKKFSNGLILSHVLGKLYLLHLLEDNLTHKSLRKKLDAIFKEINQRDGYELLIGIYDEKKKRITFTQIGTFFKVTNDKKEGGVAVGWKYSLNFNQLTIYHKRLPILKIKSQ
jgi:hypothetical protein